MEDVLNMNSSGQKQMRQQSESHWNFTVINYYPIKGYKRIKDGSSRRELTKVKQKKTKKIWKENHQKGGKGTTDKQKTTPSNNQIDSNGENQSFARQSW